MLNLSDLYKPASSEKVQDLDHDLKKDLDELKAAIEENEMLHQIRAKPIRYGITVTEGRWEMVPVMKS